MDDDDRIIRKSNKKIHTQSPRGDIRGNQDGRPPGPELVQNPIPLPLRFVSMDTHCGPAVFFFFYQISISQSRKKKNPKWR